jgi:hypothetical protein
MIMNLIYFNLVSLLFFYIFILMIQLLLILAIIICLIILLLKTKEQFELLPSITSLNATGGNGGIKLTWIKPPGNVDRYYIILKFNKDGIPNYNIYLYDNNNELVEFHIKNIPNDYIYNVSIIYKFGNNISNMETYKNKRGENTIITDEKSSLNFSDNPSISPTTSSISNTNCRVVTNTENTNMELKDIMNLLINMDNL